jgi:hypothetical protein
MLSLVAVSVRLRGLRGDQDGNWWWNAYDIVVCDPLGSLALVGGVLAVALLLVRLAARCRRPPAEEL